MRNEYRLLLENLNDNLIKQIKSTKKIYVTGHINTDTDALASAFAIKTIANFYNADCQIIVDDPDYILKVNSMYNIVKVSEEKYDIINCQNLIKEDFEGSSLIIVDTSKRKLLAPVILANLTSFEDIFIIDHHKADYDSVESNNFFAFSASSTCEILTDIIAKNHIPIDGKLATLLYSGIMLDTRDFKINISQNTKKIIDYLIASGANIVEAKKILDLDDDEKKVFDALINENVHSYNINDQSIAICYFQTDENLNKKILGKAADALTKNDHDMTKFDTTFVIGLIDNFIYISARSHDGGIAVNEVLQKLKYGGGNHNSAGGNLPANVPIEEIEMQILEILKTKTRSIHK